MVTSTMFADAGVVGHWVSNLSFTLIGLSPFLKIKKKNEELD